MCLFTLLKLSKNANKKAQNAIKSAELKVISIEKANNDDFFLQNPISDKIRSLSDFYHAKE